MWLAAMQVYWNKRTFLHKKKLGLTPTGLVRGDSRREERKMRLSSRRVSPILAWGDFHARSRFARSTIPEEKWGLKIPFPSF